MRLGVASELVYAEFAGADDLLEVYGVFVDDLPSRSLPHRAFDDARKEKFGRGDQAGESVLLL